MDEFVEADNEAAVLAPETLLPAPVSNVVEFRKQLIRSHHKADGLVAKLRGQGRADAEALVISLIDELVGETDNLLGNELVATHNGELRDASIISHKRSEVLEKAIKAVQAKRAYEREGGLDLDSPEMMTVFRYFMTKVNETFQLIGVAEEQSDIFFENFSKMTDEWKKDILDLIEQTKDQR